MKLPPSQRRSHPSGRWLERPFVLSAPGGSSSAPPNSSHGSDPDTIRMMEMGGSEWVEFSAITSYEYNALWVFIVRVKNIVQIKI